MFYRAIINLNFHNVSDADDVIDKAEDSLGDAITVNPGHDNEERSYIELQQCFHDEDPTKPCFILKHIEPE